MFLQKIKNMFDFLHKIKSYNNFFSMRKISAYELLKNDHPYL